MSTSTPQRKTRDVLSAQTGNPRGRERITSAAGPGPLEPDLVEVWGLDSFPASDPPANW